MEWKGAKDMRIFFINSWAVIVKGLSAAGGFILGLYGEWDVLMTVLVCCMAVDYLLGVIVAVMGKSRKTENGGLSSDIGFKGLLRKGVIMMMVLLASLVDRAIGVDTNAFRTMACLFYIANEGLSVLENSALAGVPWPEKLKGALEQMKRRGEEKEIGD